VTHPPPVFQPEPRLRPGQKQGLRPARWCRLRRI